MRRVFAKRACPFSWFLLCALAGVYVVGVAEMPVRADPFDLIRTFSKPEPAFNDQFGISVMALGEDVVVGAWLDDTTGVPDAGAYYVFDGSNGDLVRIFRNPTPSFGDGFGLRTATVVGGDLFLGDPGDDFGRQNSGSGYYLSQPDTRVSRWVRRCDHPVRG